jgi:hypothetical protein
MIDELIRWSAGPGVRVRGGSSVGLMELISRTIHNGGGHMLGVVVLPLEFIGDTPGELKAVSNMHHSKAEMARQSDAFIILPDNYCSFLLFCERQRVEDPDLIWCKCKYCKCKLSIVVTGLYSIYGML